jgi:hypothetical protein
LLVDYLQPAMLLNIVLALLSHWRAFEHGNSLAVQLSTGHFSQHGLE